MRLSRIIWVGSKPNCLFNRLDMHRGEGDIKIEVGIRMMQPQTKEHQEYWQHQKLEEAKN